MAKLFVDTTVASALATARESIEVGVNEDGVTVVKFALARGKGTGAQEIPVAELGAFIEALQGYADNGLSRSAKTFCAVDMLHATISMNRSKPNMCPFLIPRPGPQVIATVTGLPPLLRS